MNYIEHLFINISYPNENFINFYFALKAELQELKENYQLNIKTIYIAVNDLLFLSNEQLSLILQLIDEITNQSVLEYSFEIGYQTLQQEDLAILKQFHINRLVWKIRTFNPSLLTNVNKKFNSDAIMPLLQKSIVLGYQNFSIDLEDNILNQTTDDIINDLKIALEFKAPHISYQSNSFYHNYENKKIITNFLSSNNYDNYEFFSFALAKNNYSQQTIAYLSLKNWYGLGPNAGSFLMINNKILTIANNKQIPWTKKTTFLDTQAYDQLLVTQHLMLKSGLLLKDIRSLEKNPFWTNINNLINQDLLQIENNHLKATNQGWVLLNDVLIDIISTK